ncbi:hypothetical protein EDC14_100169 [Hydrogenispora ethanolica]|jgi:hypothetical protein|uniref:Uncharacterized protein n=1 Tax=Hydrogenispora ethanolica TaxID=1082276 RepID=A0A4R1SBJ8_HYDET|nr:SiaB family protein kinase [Hydrogenispora ethanolica]TCL76789.1 hypothetical protein EDC14_100169 [Hydrogenispora ethanolica]
MKLLQLQERLRDFGVLISFSGRFSQGIIEELGEAIKEYMEADERPKNDIYNVFAVFIEQTQNIKNYATRKEGCPQFERIVNSGIVCIGKNSQGYVVWAGNLVENRDLPALSARLESIVRLSKEELKKLYKEQLKKELPAESGGAGIGLIEIARKAGAPLEYSIEPIDPEFSFYELKVII